METLHHLNILTHIIAGTIALITGLLAFLVSKGSATHIRYGRYFTWMIGIVILTGLIGVFVFKRNNFLLVITLLSGYTCFSGIRAVKLNGQTPGPMDYLASVMVMASAFYYVYYLQAMGLFWSPVITYSTIGALFLICLYDLFKLRMPHNSLKKAVIYEHVYKMISAFSAIASAFSGTVFPQYKPYSQFLPSVIGITCIIVIFIRLSHHQVSIKRSSRLQQTN
jgi:hypothetical protein